MSGTWASLAPVPKRHRGSKNHGVMTAPTRYNRDEAELASSGVDAARR